MIRFFKELPLFIKIAIFSQVLVVAGIIWIATLAVYEVNERGLREVFKRAWCGQNVDC
jgi:hypothetical protein